MFDFRELVKDFSLVQVYKIEKTECHYDYTQGGIWIEGIETEVEIDGAVVPLTTQDVDRLDYRDNLAYVRNSRKLYTHTELNLNDKVKHKGKVYTIQDKKGYEDFDIGLGIYIIRRNDN